MPLLATAYGVLVVALWANRRLPGIGLALVGTALNATAILVNGGFMPVWDQALAAAGMTPADDRLADPFRAHDRSAAGLPPARRGPSAT